MNKKFAIGLIFVGLIVCLGTTPTRAQLGPFISYPPPEPSPELLAALRLGMQSPQEGLVRLREFLNQTSDRALAGTLLAQIADFEYMAGDKVARRSTLNKIVREYPNSNFEVEAAYNLIDLDHDFDDINGNIGAIDALGQRFGAPRVQQLAERQPAALTKFRDLQPDLRKSLGKAYSCLPLLYSRKKDTKSALAFAQISREMKFSGYGPKSILKIVTGKSWDGQTTQNPVVKVVKPTSHRTGSRPRIVVEISDGDYREPQLNWDKFQFSLDGQDLKLKAANKSQFDTQLRENHVFERLRLIYRPDTPLAPGQHTLVIYAPVHGYLGPGLGATRVEYNFLVPPANQRNSNDRDDEGAEPDDRDFR